MSDTKTKACGGEDTPLSVLDQYIADANTIYEGNRLLWVRRDTGYAQTSTYAVSNPQNVVCLGVIDQHFDNTTGNAFGNSGNAGQRGGQYKRGVFLCQGDGTVLQSSIGLPVFLVTDVTGSNNGLVTVSLSSAAGSRPLVGFVTTNPRSSSDNPDPSKIPIAIGIAPFPAGVPATLQNDYIDDATIHTAAFTVVPGVMHTFNFQNTANINFPAVTSLIDGYRLALLNQGTGATASTLVGSGTTNIGLVGSGTTGATAAGPASLKVQTYVANNTLGSWIPGL